MTLREFRKWKFKILGIILLCLPMCLLAETFYINQSPSAILYDNPSDQANILMQLAKSSPVALLKTNLENGFSYIQTEKGEKGWVRTDDLTDATPSKQSNGFGRFWSKLAGIFAPRQNNSSPTSQQSTANASSVPASTTDHDNSSQKAQGNASDNSDTSNNMNLTFQQLRENYKLMLFTKSQILAIDDQVKDLQTQVDSMRNNKTMNQWYWFAAGALSMFIGLILGLLIGGRRKRSQNGWYIK